MWQPGHWIPGGNNWSWQPGQYVPPPHGADDLGAGPMGAATHRRLDLAGGPLGLTHSARGELRPGSFVTILVWYRAAREDWGRTMKLLWFHLMPYTELPEDFRQKHPSVWVDIHSSLFDPKRAHLMYNDFMDEMEYAADCGFDAVCCNEHHSNGYGLMPSPNLIASAMSRRTRDTAICVMGNSLALYNPPTRVAEEFAMIDCISGGRLIAGFPVGTPMDTCYCYGQNPTLLRERYLEAHDLVMKAWQERRHLRVQRPLQPAALCEHLAAPGAASASAGVDPRRRLDRDVAVVRQMDYVYAYLSYFGYKDGKETMDGFWAKWRAWARTAIQTAPASCNSSAWRRPAKRRWSCIASRPNTSMAAACTPIRVGDAARLHHRGTKRAGLQSQVGRAATDRARAGARATQMEDIVDRGYVIVGSPDEVVEQLTEVATALNVGHLMLLLQFGNMGKELAKYNTKLFAEKVMPRLQPLFAEWEDRWWPQPMEAAQRADVPAFVPGLAAE